MLFPQLPGFLLSGAHRKNYFRFLFIFVNFLLTTKIVPDNLYSSDVNKSSQEEAMKTRYEIADELLKDCPAESLEDHQNIAAAIKRGDNRDDILNMAETDRWPETYVWLKGEL